MKNTQEFLNFSARLKPYIQNSRILECKCRTAEEARERLLSFAREFFLHSEYANALGIGSRRQRLTLYAIEGTEGFAKIEEALAVKGEKNAVDRTADHIHESSENEGLFPKAWALLKNRKEKNVSSCQIDRERLIDLKAPEIIDGIANWLKQIDALLVEVPDEKPVIKSEVPKTSPLLKERYCRFFQEVLGTLHRHAAHEQEIANEELQFVRFLRSEGIEVLWPASDLRESTAQFQVHRDPFIQQDVDSLPCLKWSDVDWLSGERRICAQ